MMRRFLRHFGGSFPPNSRISSLSNAKLHTSPSFSQQKHSTPKFLTVHSSSSTVPHRIFDPDSESEDNPRRVLDTDGDVTLVNCEPAGFTFKIRDFKPMGRDQNGNWVPLSGGILACRPVPSPANVQRVQAAMGHGTNGVWVGTVFTPTNADASTASMFAPRLINAMDSRLILERFVLRRRHVPSIGSLKTMLMFTDGSCLANGMADPRAGWAFIFRTGSKGMVSGVLEQKGPDGELHIATSNRAELRAVIAALEFRSWWGEGWERIVIATDSEYVVNGATSWLRAWAARGWRTLGGSPVKNRDLWERLSERMRMCAEGGSEVSFWRIPRGWNSDADQAAKKAAGGSQSMVESRPLQGVLV
ncbi:putative rnase h domain protein [Podospora fimiseda]|uniref:ribonuclease H n=1 Tax=Podospora fimiseda TaxID=252190 RepID=A0AAN7BVA1_9PEZI|nr:putative rnase h domain protein [Podospora fimiseda]